MAAGEKEARLRRIASAQEWVFTAGDAHSVGLDAAACHRRLAAGEWLRLYPRAYAFAGSRITDRQRIMSATLTVGRGAVASHRCAAWVWGMDVTLVIEVTAGRGTRSTRRSPVVHEAIALPPATRHGAIPITTPEATVLTLAAVLDERALADALDDALLTKRVCYDRLVRMCSQTPRGTRGTAQLRRFLDERAPVDGAAEKGLEVLLRRLLREWKLPPHVGQHEVWDGSRLIAILDVAWPGRRVGIAGDGARWHLGASKLTHDRRQDNWFTANGWVVFRATKQMLVHEPDVLRDQVMTSLAARPRPRSASGQPVVGAIGSSPRGSG